MQRNLLQTIDKMYSNSIHNLETDCYLWQGCMHEKGYGRIRYQGRVEKVHRISFMYYKGAIIEGVYHTCDIPNCWNPDHLFTGTNIDNIRDKVIKGRQARGSNSSNKLEEYQVRAIRISTTANKALARVYGVSSHTIRDIKNRVTWRCLDAPID